MGVSWIRSFGGCAVVFRASKTFTPLTLKRACPIRSKAIHTYSGAYKPQVMLKKTEPPVWKSTGVKMLPTACFVVWVITFVGLGVFALSEDYSLKDKEMPCGKYHVWKYALINTVLQCFVFVTYFVIAGGGEGARARVMVCVLFHFACAVWGILLWTSLDPVCEKLLQEQYRTLYAFFHVCVVSNLFNFGLFVTHEVYLGPKMGVDLTLMPEIHYAVIQRPPSEHIPRLSDPGPPPQDDGFFP